MALQAEPLLYRPAAEAFIPFAHEPMALLLDGEHGNGISYIAVRPSEVIRAFPGRYDPLDWCAARCRPSLLPMLEGIPAFQTGWAGMWHYEAGCSRENIPHHHDKATPWLCLGYYPVIAAFDARQKKAWLVYDEYASQRINIIKEKLQQDCHIPHHPPGTLAFQRVSPPFNPQVERAIAYIKAGDMYQVNLAQRWEADLPKDFDPYAAFLHLRCINPAPWAAFMNTGDTAIACLSPEEFLNSNTTDITTRPIKGTAPRNSDPAELQASTKNRAENLMIVDLLRNDLAQCCVPGSVRVTDLYALETHPSVYHLVSTITGTLTNNNTALDAFAAAFPGGSITGAPKIRAMQIIHELEDAPRRAYCGSIGFASTTGHLGTNIAIRTVQFYNNKAVVWGGGGITSGSESEDENTECLHKVMNLIKNL